MSEFYVYDGAARVGILEHWSSVQWLEQYASGGEAKIVAMATPQNVALLAVGRALYNPLCLSTPHTSCIGKTAQRNGCSIVKCAVSG